MSDDKLTIQQRLDIGDEAKRLLSDKLFNSVLNQLVRNYMATLMTTRPGSEEGLIAHAGLNALEDIKRSLKALENDAAKVRHDLEKKGTS